MLKNVSRRYFLRTAPASAAATLVLTDTKLLGAAVLEAEKFQVFTAAQLTDHARALEAKPGNNNLITLKQVAVVMTTEKAHAAAEFEWHDGRDHIVQIVDGSTVYEVGGTPRNGRSTKAGEYLAPESEGSTRMTLKKGDMLTIPRGTPHKRSTAESVTFLLISPSGMMI